MSNSNTESKSYMLRYSMSEYSSQQKTKITDNIASNIIMDVLKICLLTFYNMLILMIIMNFSNLLTMSSHKFVSLQVYSGMYITIIMAFVSLSLALLEVSARDISGNSFNISYVNIMIWTGVRIFIMFFAICSFVVSAIINLNFIPINIRILLILFALLFIFFVLMRYTILHFYNIGKNINGNVMYNKYIRILRNSDEDLNKKALKQNTLTNNELLNKLNTIIIQRPETYDGKYKITKLHQYLNVDKSTNTHFAFDINNVRYGFYTDMSNNHELSSSDKITIEEYAKSIPDWDEKTLEKYKMLLYKLAERRDIQKRKKEIEQSREKFEVDAQYDNNINKQLSDISKEIKQYSKELNIEYNNIDKNMS